MGRGWCVGRPGSVTGQRVSRQAEERQGACGPTCIGDRQLLHRNEPTFAPASRAREHRVVAAAAEVGWGGEEGSSRWPHLGGPRAVHRR